MEKLGLKDLIAKLKVPLDLTDDKLFQQIIASALKYKSIDELANGLLVSKSSIKNWSQGKNLPAGKLLRKGIYKYLSDELESLIDTEIIVLQAVLSNINPDCDDFKMYLDQCIWLEIVTEEEIANQFEFPVGEIRKWRSGTEKAHHFIRPHIFKWLLNKVNEVDTSRRH